MKHHIAVLTTLTTLALAVPTGPLPAGSRLAQAMPRVENLANYACTGFFNSMLVPEQGRAEVMITEQTNRHFRGSKMLDMFGDVHNFVLEGTLAQGGILTYVGKAANAHLVVHGAFMEDAVGLTTIMGDYLLKIAGMPLDKGFAELECFETD